MIQTTLLRPAIAMIELIFAIVIMGIALLSVPNLLSVSSNSSLVVLQQEAIAMAASHTNALLTYAWDEQNTDSLGLYVTNKLHVTSSGRDTRLDANATGITNITFPTARNRTFAPTGVVASAIGVDINDSNDDVDDFNGINSNTTEAILGGATNTADAGEYIDINISQDTTVSYGSDTASYDASNGVFTFHRPFLTAAPGGITNIKLISTRLRSNSTDAELQEKDIKLNAFMCNIGGNNPNTLGGI